MPTYSFKEGVDYGRLLEPFMGNANFIVPLYQKIRDDRKGALIVKTGAEFDRKTLDKVLNFRGIVIDSEDDIDFFNSFNLNEGAVAEAKKGLDSCLEEIILSQNAKAKQDEVEKLFSRIQSMLLDKTYLTRLFLLEKYDQSAFKDLVVNGLLAARICRETGYMEESGIAVGTRIILDGLLPLGLDYNQNRVYSDDPRPKQEREKEDGLIIETINFYKEMLQRKKSIEAALFELKRIADPVYVAVMVYIYHPEMAGTFDNFVGKRLSNTIQEAGRLKKEELEKAVLDHRVSKEKKEPAYYSVPKMRATVEKYLNYASVEEAFAKKLSDTIDDKGQPITKVTAASRLLKELGYTKLKGITGELHAWEMRLKGA